MKKLRDLNSYKDIHDRLHYLANFFEGLSIAELREALEEIAQSPHLKQPKRESRVEPDRNEQFKRICKLGTDINMLIGAARSVSGMDKSHGVRKEWVDSLLARADAAGVAWDGIVAMFKDEDVRRQP